MKHILLLLLLSACATDTQKPLVGVDLKNSWPNPQWQAYVYEKVKVLPRTADEKEWCPQGLTRANWTHLLSAMAYYESGYRPKHEYLEKFRRTDNGQRVISTGLFQVSQESSRGYGHFVTQEQMHDPYTNIDIAISILKKWTLSDGVVANHSGTNWKGGSRFWSVLRPSGKLAQVKARMRQHCQ